MYPKRPYRNVCRLLPAGLLFVLAANSLLADSFTITGTADTSTIPGISMGDTWTGMLTTNGTCSVCTIANGGLLTLSIDMYGHMLSASDGTPTFYRNLDGLTVSNVTLDTDDDVLNIVNDGTFGIDRSEGPFVRGTYGISPGSIPEPAGIVLLSTVLVITFVTLRKKKAIGS